MNHSLLALPLCLASFALAGCYASYEETDVPSSICVDDAATVALTPENRTPGGCEEIEIRSSPDVVCPQPTPIGFYQFPRAWRRARFVNATDRTAYARIGAGAPTCPVPLTICWAYARIETECGCPEVSAASTEPAPEGRADEYFEVPPFSESQHAVTGADARLTLRLCDTE